MLTDLTLDYYYSNTNISITAIFEEIYISIQTYFEGVEYKRKIQSK